MKVLINNVPVSFDSLKVIWENEFPNPDKQLHMSVTHEGIILDVIDSGEGDDVDDVDDVEKTASLELEDLDEMCH